jgi:ABC-type uncharacterized transport system ATPase subunit
MKILYGFYRADSGEIDLDGQPVRIRAPYDARKSRTGMLFQDFVQIRALTVAENIPLFLPRLPAILDKTGPIKGNKGVERVKRGQHWSMDNRGKMDRLTEGIIGQPK